MAALRFAQVFPHRLSFILSPKYPQGHAGDHANIWFGGFGHSDATAKA